MGKDTMVPLLSLRPKWAALIASGKKTAELRKSLPDWPRERLWPEMGDRMWIYETAPVKKITGWVQVSAVRWLPVDRLWEAVKDISCVDRSDFLAYYGRRSTGCFAEIRKWRPLASPLSLEAVGLSRPPQNWQWIDDDAVTSALGVSRIR